MPFFAQQVQLVRSPRHAIAALEANPRAAFVGLGHVLFLAVLWELAVVLWALGGATPTMPAFLRIADAVYYRYQLIFMIPMFVLVWLLAGSVAYVLAKALGGRGSFDAVLGGFGIAAPVAGYFALVPDFIQGILWTTGWVPFEEYQDATSEGPLLVVVIGYLAAYCVAYVWLYAATLVHALHVGRTRSAVVAAVAFLTSAALFMTVVR